MVTHIGGDTLIVTGKTRIEKLNHKHKAAFYEW